MSVNSEYLISKKKIEFFIMLTMAVWLFEWCSLSATEFRVQYTRITLQSILINLKNYRSCV